MIHKADGKIRQPFSVVELWYNTIIMREEIENTLWVEKYRPHTLDDIVLPANTRKLVSKWVAEGIIPNLLLCSLPGQGKTSLAKLLAKEVFKVDYLYINASDENGVDAIRMKVSEFARTASFDGNFKIVILDECDNFPTPSAQKILRGLMEEVSSTTRFILTANYGHRVIDAIKSRCTILDMTPPRVEIAKRLYKIIQAEGVTLPNEQFPMLGKLIENFYPDMRSIISRLNDAVINGELDLRPYATNGALMSGVINLIQENKPIELRKYVIENELEFCSNYQGFLQDLYKAVMLDDNIEARIKAKWVICLGEYCSRFSNAVDPELNTAACLFSLCELR